MSNSSDLGIPTIDFSKMNVTGLPQPDFRGVKLTKTASQSTNSGVFTPLTWDSEVFDSDAFHDNLSNNSRITIPSGVAGKYLIGATITWAANSTGTRRIAFRKNGGTDVEYVLAVSNVTVDFTLCVTTVFDLVAGDFIECSAFQSSGGALNVQATGNETSAFWALRLGI